ncbi:protein NYNRIN-like [Uranotaenia lowii]|uniref:protein NYNRIN-like n=1 Tax=Uranotaenia lowii TaxID=190385 RepID=UPI0024796C93|nr:protein NYNRIN-like [Uranotaenia lowii]
MDLVGPLPPSEGNMYCLTIIDKFTRWPEIFPLPIMTAITVARAFINGWIARFGVPTHVTTDCGRQFESELFNTLTKLLGITHLRTTPYHPQANGQIERTHRQLKAAIMCHQHSRWTEVLPIVLLGMRSSIKEDLQATCAELTYGTTLRLPGEFFQQSDLNKPTSEFVTDFNAIMSQLRPTPTANHSKNSTFIQKDLFTCSHVFVKVGAIKPPLTPPYDGPFRVIRRKKKIFIIEVNGKPTAVSIDRLKAAFLQAEAAKEDDTSTRKAEEPHIYKTRSGHNVRIAQRYW